APEIEPTVAGEAAKGALETAVKKPSAVRSAYEEVENLLHTPDARSSLANTTRAMNQIIAERQAASLGDSNAVKFLEKAATEPEGLTVKGLSDLRSAFGEKTPQQLIAEGISPREAKRLYGPLTDDLRQAVHNAGGEEALSAWENANALARQSIQQRK